MRISLFQTIITFLCISFANARTTNAQEILDQKVSINVSQQEVEKILERIETEANIKFMYSPQLIMANRKVSLVAKKEKLSTVLEELLKPLKINYEVVGRKILLKRLSPKTALKMDVEDKLGILESNIVEQTIKGKITDAENNETIAGVSIAIKGTTQGTTTDANGNFSLVVPNEKAVLVITSVGYDPQEITVGNRFSINISLVPDSKNLNEVVVVGYGTQKVTNVSGAIATVKGADIEKLRPVRPEDALQGRASGVTVISNGSPGSKPTVLIRGIPSFSGTDPVVIIDGVPQTLNDFNSINSADIESMNVLKDAATTAIYGVKGGNGVIVVTTKSGGKNQKAEISYSSNYGVQQVMNTIGVLNATEYAAILNEGSLVSGGGLIFKDLTTIGLGTDWQKQVFKDAPLQSHNVSVKGGSEKVQYFLSGGYLGQDGIVGGGENSNFNRLNFTTNLTFQIAPKLKFLANTSYVNIKSVGVQENSFNSIIGSALNFDPTVSVLNTVPNTVGKYGFSNLLLSEIFNPLTKLDNNYNESNGNKLYGKLELQYEVIKNLTLSSRFGYTNFNNTFKSFTPLAFYGPLNVENTMNADGSTVTGRHNSVYESKRTDNTYTFETFGTYNFSINNDHHFETVLGISLAKIAGDEINGSRQDVPFNSWTFADLTSATGINTATNTNAQTVGNGQYFRKNLSYFGRVNYDYKDKYLVSFSARRDGSYAFGIDNKFANFYAGSLGWVISNEDFFSVDFLNYLKIRGSYGSIGNENVNPQYVGIISGGPSYAGDANSNGYTFGNTFTTGSTVGSYANTTLRWEKQLQSNFGFDVRFGNNKWSLSADYFDKSVDGLLFTPSISLYLGAAAAPTANIGSTKSSGVDLNLGYNAEIVKDLKLNTNVTFTTSKNLVTATNSDGTAIIPGGSYFNGQSQTATRFQQGFAPGYFYGFKTNGLFQNTAQIAEAPTQTGAVPGDIRFVDVNGDGQITDLDKTQIGNPFPDFTMGWNLGITYKSLDLNVFTYASVGNDIYRAYERNAIYSNKFRSVLGRWTGEGSTNDANNPRFSFVDANSNIRVSDRYIEDGSFVKIKNIQIGYTLPYALVPKKVVNKIRIYAQVKNAFTFTKYSGYDPEIPGGVLDTGVDRGNYPQARTWSIGVDVRF
ncbi:TonB-dependent receptor [Arcicella rosea]|uniref:TonB-linked SusC/RagA family outer membrane protein n=1 Tax=Arcicella rosea TaxID=502909 RepID=A0A841EM48_9BACT|nr:TonB-dependent receptor [Arcicella rosea]MBB6004006.1 TonB-linked SusC/RagA family outer membrane protein [Arcicella rosea]